MPTQLQDQLFLKPSEVARRLSVDRSTVYRWMDDGTLPSVWVGPQSRRIPAGALEVYLQRRQPGGEERERSEIAELIKQVSSSTSQASSEFEHETGMSPNEFSDRWRQSDIEDTAENTRLALRALALKSVRAAEGQPV
jgi:excisionase family DNA binding protein